MPNNYLTVFPIPSGREIETLTQEASGQLEMIASVVNSRQKFEEQDPHYNFFEKHIFFPILTRLLILQIILIWKKSFIVMRNAMAVLFAAVFAYPEKFLLGMESQAGVRTSLVIIV